MIENPVPAVDRLSAVIRALAPAACAVDADDPRATLRVLSAAGLDAQERLRLRLRGVEGAPPPARAAAIVRFGGAVDTVLGDAPDMLEVTLDGCPRLGALVEVFVAESEAPRCGGAETRARLAEAITTFALRRVVETAAPQHGLLAGLAHPRLHRALAAIHDRPEAPWTLDGLSALAGMSRSRFAAVFGDLVGATPVAYVAGLRLEAARTALAEGRSVKEVAGRAGFASTAAFSRAYRRTFAAPPSAARRAG